MLTGSVDKYKNIPWFRVTLGIVFLVLIYIAAMALMLAYRMSFLALAVAQFCPNQEQNIYCITNITYQLAYADQWLAIQFCVYFILSFFLWFIFNNAKGRPLINLLIVAIVSTVIIKWVTENVGIELYASFFCPLFIGLLITSRRNKKIKINYNINRFKSN